MNIRLSIKDLRLGGAHNCGSGGRWFESTQLYQDWLRKLAKSPAMIR
jgi:hypothetical protein